jgi:glycosyltransferase involved in cell wall biosynthesis
MNLVSICIPTYNGGRYISEALESAILQSYGNLEIIISDDSSNDNTLDIIESFKQKTNIHIKIFNHRPNGIGANWNNCLKRAEGKFIKFLFQDDILQPTCIEEMVNVLETYHGIGLVASKREFIVEDSHLNEDTKKWIDKYGDLQVNLDPSLSSGMQILDASLFKSNVFFREPRNKVGEPSAVLFRKEILNNIGFFREDLKQVLDYEFYYRILKKQNIAILPKKLIKFRLHDQQATSINDKANDILDYVKYDRIIYDNYFWYLNNNKRFELLKKHNRIIRLLLNFKNKLLL